MTTAMQSDGSGRRRDSSWRPRLPRRASACWRGILRTCTPQRQRPSSILRTRSRRGRSRMLSGRLAALPPESVLRWLRRRASRLRRRLDRRRLRSEPPGATRPRPRWQVRLRLAGAALQALSPQEAPLPLLRLPPRPPPRPRHPRRSLESAVSRDCEVGACSRPPSTPRQPQRCSLPTSPSSRRSLGPAAQAPPVARARPLALTTYARKRWRSIPFSTRRGRSVATTHSLRSMEYT